MMHVVTELLSRTLPDWGSFLMKRNEHVILAEIVSHCGGATSVFG